MTREQFIRVCFIALLIYIVYQIFLIFIPFSQSIFWSAILTFAFYPVYQKIRALMGKREILAALLTTALIFLLVVPPVIYLIINLTSQAIQFYQLASDYVREGRLENLIETIRSLEIFQNIQNQSSNTWVLIKEDTAAWLLKASKDLGNFAALQLATLTKNLFFVIIQIFFMTVLIFIFLKDGEKIYQFVYESAPLEEKNKRPIFKQINETFEAVIRGQLLTAVSQAVISGIVFWILDIPLGILFATALFFAALIPITGAATVWVPLSIYLYLTHQTTKAVILFIFGVLVISLLDNFIKPMIIGEKTRLPYFLLFFGILGGISVYGLMGVFIAPVVLSLFFSLVRIYQEKNW